MEYNIIIAGVGGQGTVLASKLIAAAAMKKGFSVRTSETIGMAQRGGCVTSHVRIASARRDAVRCATGGNICFSPIIGQKSADMLISMELAETVRVLPLLKDGGTVISCNNAIFPTTGVYNKEEIFSFLKKNTPSAFIADCEDFIKENGTKTLNVYLLAAAAESKKLPFSTSELEEVVRQNIPPKFIELNLSAFKAGKEECIKNGQL